MSEVEWAELLRNLSRAVLRSPMADELPRDVRQSEWLGFDGATDAQIATAEQRLAISLPPSYRSFLKVSNGWRRPSQSIERVRPVEEIDWFRKQNRDWIRAYTEPFRYERPPELPHDQYFAYGDQAADFKPAHFKETLQISDVDDGVYLLNPQVITKDGEWEAWFAANWLPGVRRFRSFREMMQFDYHSAPGDGWQPPVGVIGDLPDEYTGSPGNPKRTIKKRRKPREPKILERRLSEWTIEELIDLGLQADMPVVWNEVIHALILMNDQRAVEPLVRLLGRTDDAAVYARDALERLAPDRLRDG